MKILALVAVMVVAVFASAAYAQPPARDVTVANTPLPVAVDSTCCTGAIRNVIHEEGVVSDPVAVGDYDLVSIAGSGTFVSAFLHKQGTTDNIVVRLIIDGEDVIRRVITALKSWGFTQQNPYGVVVLGSPGMETVAIGFPQPLRFEQSLVLQAKVGTAFSGQIVGAVIYGE